MHPCSSTKVVLKNMPAAPLQRRLVTLMTHPCMQAALTVVGSSERLRGALYRLYRSNSSSLSFSFLGGQATHGPANAHGLSYPRYN